MSAEVTRSSLLVPSASLLLAALFLFTAPSRPPQHLPNPAPLSVRPADSPEAFWPLPPLLTSPVPSEHPTRQTYARLATIFLRPFITAPNVTIVPPCTFSTLFNPATPSAVKSNCTAPPPARRISRHTLLNAYLHHHPAPCPACVLLQIRAGALYLHDPRGQRSHAAPFRATRLQDAVCLVASAVRRGVIRDSELVLSLSDAPPVPSAAPHPYRLARVSGPPTPIFAPARCSFAHAIPFPHVLADARRRAGDDSTVQVGAWDTFIKSLLALKIPTWNLRRPAAVFRGAVRVSAAHVPAAEFHEACHRAGRPALWRAARAAPSLLDVGLTGACGDRTFASETLGLREQAKRFRFVLHAEGNAFWADRLAVLPFLPVALLRQTLPCGMFFEPLLRPFRHFVPVHFSFRDVVRRTKWLAENDDLAKEMARQMRDFAANFLSEAGVQTYVDELLKSYTEALETKEFDIMPGAVRIPL